MKTKILFLFILISLIINTGFSQEKTKKQLKAERKIEKQNQIETMIGAGEFVFNATTALPTGYPSVNLTSSANYVKFRPDWIESYMPFYGNAYSGVGFGGDNGLKFEGKPEEMSTTKGKKSYRVKAVVKSEKDNFRLSLSVSFDGNATLTIDSNNRSSISYSGEIAQPVTQKKAK